MAMVKRIGPASAFKVGLVVYGMLGLIAGVLCSVMGLAAVSFAPHGHIPFMHGFTSLFALILCPLLYGIIGGVAAVLGALIYNLASGWVGGLEVDIT
jgi:hypothetical protein